MNTPKETATPAKTLRDEFAAAVLPAIIDKAVMPPTAEDILIHAGYAYLYADAMLIARVENQK